MGKYRFCSFIDRRKPDDKDNKDKEIFEKDEIIIFEPPNDCNQFPEDKQQPLFYFDTARTCIIPNMTYPKEEEVQTNNDDDEDDDDSDQKDVELNRTITSMSACNGAMMTLSFHVEAIDEIRCYLYMNGQAMRFMPEDIVKVLPKFFDPQFRDNFKWTPHNKEAQKLIARMNGKLKDSKFEAFLNKYKTRK